MNIGAQKPPRSGGGAVTDPDDHLTLAEVEALRDRLLQASGLSRDPMVVVKLAEIAGRLNDVAMEMRAKEIGK